MADSLMWKVREMPTMQLGQTSFVGHQLIVLKTVQEDKKDQQ